MNERDPELEALWRARSTETPPSPLDDAIRAAAHRAVHAGPAPAARSRAPWPAWAPLAAAASIGVIAIGVWQLQPKDTDVTTATVSDVPLRMAAAPRPSAPASPAATGGYQAPAARDNAAATERKDEDVAASTDAKRQAPAQRSEPMVASPADAKPGAAAQRSEPMAAPSAGVQRAAPVRQSGAIVASPPPASAPSANTPKADAPANAPMAMVAPPPAPTAPLAKVAPALTQNEPVASPSMAAGSLSDKRAMDASERAQSAPRQEAGATAGAGKDTSGNARMAGNSAPSDGGASRMAARPAPNEAENEANKAPMRSKAAAQPDAFERASPAASPAARAADNTRTVASYVDAIRHALDAHQIDLAIAQLTAMRAKFPDADAKLPMELRVWAATVPRDNP